MPTKAEPTVMRDESREALPRKAEPAAMRDESKAMLPMKAEPAAIRDESGGAIEAVMNSQPRQVRPSASRCHCHCHLAFAPTQSCCALPNCRKGFLCSGVSAEISGCSSLTVPSAPHTGPKTMTGISTA